MKMPKSLDEFWSTNEAHNAELTSIQELLLDCGYTETFKWAFPTYTIDGQNLISIGSFKNHVAIWFFQGVFLQDEANVLVNAQKGKTKGMRQWRIENGQDLNLDLIRKYILETIENHKAGKKVKIERKKGYEMPPELSNALRDSEELNNSFFRLTEGKQREYANYISYAKQDKTKESRIQKCTPLILEGKGLNDAYKKS